MKSSQCIGALKKVSAGCFRASGLVMVLMCLSLMMVTSLAGVPTEYDPEVIKACFTGKPGGVSGYYYSWRNNWQLKTDMDVLKIGYASHPDVYTHRYGKDVRKLQKICLWQNRFNIKDSMIEKGVNGQPRINLEALKNDKGYQQCLKSNFDMIEIIDCDIDLSMKDSKVKCMDHLFAKILQDDTHFQKHVKEYGKLQLYYAAEDGQYITEELEFNGAMLIPWLVSGHTEFYEISEKMFNHVKGVTASNLLLHFFKKHGAHCKPVEIDYSYIGINH